MDFTTHSERYGVPVHDSLSHNEAEQWVQGYKAGVDAIRRIIGDTGYQLTRILEDGEQHLAARRTVPGGTAQLLVAKLEGENQMARTALDFIEGMIDEIEGR